MFLFGVFCLWLGIKRFRCSGDEWFRRMVEQSGYTESEIREFDRQISNPGSIAVTLSEKGQPGALLTETYFVLEPGVPMKYSDIKGAYLIDYPEAFYTGKTMKTVLRRNLAVFPNTGTSAARMQNRKSHSGYRPCFWNGIPGSIRQTAEFCQTGNMMPWNMNT